MNSVELGFVVQIYSWVGFLVSSSVPREDVQVEGGQCSTSMQPADHMSIDRV